MECAICHKKEPSKTRCVGGHYVCSDCHTQGMDTIFGLCLAETSADPAAILRRMMDLPFCHMHGPEHHVLVGAALLTAYPAGSTYTLPVLTEVWTEQLVSHRGYFRYCDLLSAVIETNCSIERLAAFKARYHEGQDALVDRFAQNLHAEPARMGQLLMAVYYHAVGINSWCYENPLIQQALELAGLPQTAPDFRGEMRGFVAMCLAHYAS